MGGPVGTPPDVAEVGPQPILVLAAENLPAGRIYAPADHAYELLGSGAAGLQQRGGWVGEGVATCLEGGRAPGGVARLQTAAGPHLVDEGAPAVARAGIIVAAAAAGL